MVRLTGTHASTGVNASGSQRSRFSMHSTAGSRTQPLTVSSARQAFACQADFAVQAEPLGTADALKAALAVVADDIGASLRFATTEVHRAPRHADDDHGVESAAAASRDGL